jgi:uncharacterized protein (TIGR03067 family)
MCRMLAAILLLSSTRAFAQSPPVAEDQKQLQGIWRVREMVTAPNVPTMSAPTHLVFEEDKLIIAMPGAFSRKLRYKVDPTKNPKHLDWTITIPGNALPRQKPQPPREWTVPCIYSLEQDRLKVRVPPSNRRPVDFRPPDRGTSEIVLTLDRDASPAGRTAVQSARATLAIQELGGKVIPDLDTPTTVNVQLDESTGDASLAKLALQIQLLSSVNGLHLRRSKVTDAGLASLEGSNNIECLDLEGTAITDVGLNHLRNMTQLVHLNLTDTKVTEAGVASLRKSLPHLRVTHLSHAERDSQLAITNAGGAQSSDESGRLVEIRFARKLSDFQLLGLQKPLEVWKTTLRSIDLTDCHISDRGLDALAGLTSLRQLTLKGTDVTVAGVNALKRILPNLKVTH